MTMVHILAPSSAPMMHMASVKAAGLRRDDVVGYDGTWWAVVRVHLYPDDGETIASVVVCPVDAPLTTRRWQIAANQPVAVLRAEGVL